MSLHALNLIHAEIQNNLDPDAVRNLIIRVAELETERYGTLARRCAIPGCDAFYDAADGPTPEEATAARHWLRKSSPALLLCPDHSHLWEGDTPHTPRLDHTTSTCACTCGHPLPGPTLGHMASAWIAHALALLDDESGPDAWDFSRMEHEADVLQDRIRALEERAAAVRALHACETHYQEVTIWDPYDRGDSCDHCEALIHDAAGALTENHFTDDDGFLRCRFRPRHTCAHCIIQEDSAPWPCATITALDGGTE